MKRTTRLDYKILPIWIYIWLIVFFLILLLSLISPTGNIITLVKLGGIGLCLLYAILTFPKDYLLIAALLATSIADIILAYNNTSALGVSVFLITQLLHLLRLSPGKLNFVISYFLIAALCLTLNALLHIIPTLFLAAAFYIAILITNVVVSARWRSHEPHNATATIALAGFALFLCCDFCTGISYLSLAEVAILPAYFYSPANFFVWTFYYPSQILISNTGDPKLAKNPLSTSEKL